MSSTIVTALLRDHISIELGAACQYLATAAFFDLRAMPNVAALYYKQAQDEFEHANKFVKYVVNAGGVSVDIATVPTAKTPTSVKQAVADVLAIELDVANRIDALMRVTSRENDFGAHEFLEWFAKEQVEEVANARQRVLQIERLGDNLILFDLLHKD